MVKIFTPDENLQGIQGGLDNTLLGPSQANIQSVDSIINRSNQNIQSQSNILTSKNQMQAVKDRDRANFVNGMRQARQAASQRDAVINRETQAAEQSIAFGKHYADATLRYAEALDARKAIAYDDQGNPTYSTLAKDAGKLGTKIYANEAAKIKDPLVKRKFEAEAYQHITNTEISMYAEARNRKLDYYDATLQNNILKLTSAAIRSEPLLAGETANKIELLLQDAQKSGIDGNKINAYRQNALTNISEGKLSQLRATDLDTFNKVLAENTPEKLGVSNEFYIKSRIAGDKAKTEIQDQTIAGIELDIASGKEINKGELEKILPTLDVSRQIKLTNMYNTANKDALEAEKRRVALDVRLQSGQYLTSLDSKEVNEDYTNRLKGITTKGKVPNLLDEATLTSKYKGAPVKVFQDRITSTINYGTPEQQVQAVAAFEVAQQLNPDSVVGIDRDTYNFIGMAKTLSKDGAIPADVLVKKIQDRMGKGPEDTKDARREFDSKYVNKNPQFLEESLRDFAGDTNFIPGTSSVLDPEVLLKYSQSVKDYYGRNGRDYNAAVASANAELKLNMGSSTFGGTDRIMMYPPEQMPGLKGYSNQVLERALSIELMNKGLENTPSGYRLLPDEKTRGTFDLQGNELISYRLAKKEGNTLIAVKDKDGKYFRWEPTQGELKTATGSLNEELKFAKSKSDRLKKSPVSVNTRFGQE